MWNFCAILQMPASFEGSYLYRAEVAALIEASFSEHLLQSQTTYPKDNFCTSICYCKAGDYRW